MSSQIMNNQILNVLFEIRDRYGDMIFYDQQKTKNLMHDLAPSLHNERKYIVQFLAINGYFQLKYAAHSYPSVCARIVQTYMNTYSENSAVANWVIDIFSELLGLSDFKKIDKIIIEQPKPKEPPSIPKPTDLLSLMSEYGRVSEISDEPAEYIYPADALEPVELAKIRVPKPIKIPVTFPVKKPLQKPLQKPVPKPADLILPLSSRVSADMHSVAIMANGNVRAIGPSNDGECNVLGWHDMIAVCAGPFFTVGLRKDGRVEACGRNEFGQCNVKNWRDVANISVGARHTVALKKDGTLLATGQNRHGECNIHHWTNVIHISAGYLCTFGIKSDNTVLFAGKVKNPAAYVGHLSNVVDISNPCPERSLVLKKDGRLDVLGNNEKLQNSVAKWHDVKQISAGPDYFAGCFENGTVRILAYYWRASGIECNPDDWQEIEAIAAGRFHLLAVKKDGTMLATMLHPNRAMNKGQCMVYNWQL
ncbi:MAG: hypothetical protein FWG64_05720 [Firmicutes bacterium]|nr:hypothetical protein [Bacillota bacterium]